MNATEGLQYLASSLGLRINPEQNAASGERNGYPFIITVEQVNELLVQFQAHSEDDSIKSSMDTTIDSIKAQYGSIVYGNFSGKRANLGFQTDNTSFETDAYSAIKQLASALSEQGCKVICDHCDQETTVSPVSLNNTIYFSCPSCASTMEQSVSAGNKEGKVAFGVIASIVAMAIVAFLFSKLTGMTEKLYGYPCIVLFPLCYLSYNRFAKGLNVGSIIYCALLSAATIFAMCFLSYAEVFEQSMDNMQYFLKNNTYGVTDQFKKDLLFCYGFFAVGLVFYLKHAFHTASATAKQTFSRY